ncbi:MAG: hypothetical protein J7639_10215 [Paenibacillaceae bacterium]|nr:hypothetical protein [Paenibacillaceae bacterium]
MRKPSTIVSIAALVCLGLNILFAFAVLSPKLISQVRLDNQLDQLEAQKKELAAKPLPAKPSDADIRSLLGKVPLTDESAKLLLDLQTIMEMSGVIMSAITFDNGSTNELSTLESTIMKAAAAQSAAASPTPSPTPAASASPGAGQTAERLEEIKLSVGFTGTYVQTMDMLKRLHDNGRLLQLRNWSFVPIIASSDAAAALQSGILDGTSVNGLQGTGEGAATLLNVKLQLSAFTSQSYAGTLVSPQPAATVQPTAGRTDPVVSDENYKKLLDQLRSQGAK